MLHKKKVLLASYYSLRRSLRLKLGLKPRSRPPPVLGQPIERIVERHGSIARLFLEGLPPSLDLSGKHVCEVGPGDCLAVASLALGLGASRVEMIENSRPVVNEKQAEVLRLLKSQGLRMDLSVLQGHPLQLDTKRIAFHHCYMEDFRADVQVDFVFSHSVVEHVEDLTGFHRACWRAMSPGGWALHIVDLGGHGEFEDPVPPLDFQTYPEWLYDWMYPRYCRATRKFLSEHLQTIKQAGFSLEATRPLRTVGDEYLKSVGGNLRSAARQCPPDELAVIEFAMLARKPAQ